MWRTVALLAAFRGLRRDQLEALLLMDEPLGAASRRVVTHRVVAALRQRGLLAETVAGGGGSKPWRAYALSAHGEEVYAETEAAYPARRSRRPASFDRLQHAILLAEIALALCRGAHAAGDIDLWWESEWQVAARLGSRALFPDAFVTVERAGRRTRAFIEADRSTEWVTAFSRKVRRYVDLYRGDTWRAMFGTWPLVLTVTTSDAHARTLAQATSRIAQQEGGARIVHAFRFTSIDALRRGDPYGAIWWIGGREDPATFLAPDPLATASLTPSDIVARPDARSPERKGTESNLENFTGDIHGT